MRVLIIDNLDSFTHNLAQLVWAAAATPVVRRNTATTRDLLAVGADAIVVSPGPGRPEETGSCAEVLAAVEGRVPVLGVCLGLQLLALLRGGRVVTAPEPVHGRASALEHDGRGLFDGVAPGTPVARYHSLVVDETSIDAGLVTARAGGLVMALRDASRLQCGVQFHPESVLTLEGGRMLVNFLSGKEFEGAPTVRQR